MSFQENVDMMFPNLLKMPSFYIKRRLDDLKQLKSKIKSQNELLDWLKVRNSKNGFNRFDLDKQIQLVETALESNKTQYARVRNLLTTIDSNFGKKICSRKRTLRKKRTSKPRVKK